MSRDYSALPLAQNVELAVHTTVPHALEGEKRTYLPIDLKWTCACGASCKQDLSQQYLSYPPLYRPFDHVLYCSTCEAAARVQLRLSFALEVIP